MTTTAKGAIRTAPDALLAALAYGFGLPAERVIALACNGVDFGPITTVDDAVAALLRIDGTINLAEPGPAPRSLTETVEWLLEVSAPTCWGCGQPQSPLERTSAWACRTGGCPLQAEDPAADLAGTSPGGTSRDTADVINGGGASAEAGRACNTGAHGVPVRGA